MYVGCWAGVTYLRYTVLIVSMHFAVVADKLDLSLTQRRLEKEKYNFNCAVNKLVYVTPKVPDKCIHSHLMFDLATFLCFTHVSEA